MPDEIEYIPLNGVPTRCPRCYTRIETWDYTPDDDTRPYDPDWQIWRHIVEGECTYKNERH